MNKRILLALCLIAASLQGVLAQCYVLNDSTERNFFTIGDYTYNLDGKPAGQLTFDAKCVAFMLVWGGDLRIKQYVNGTWSDELTSVGFAAKNTYYSFGPITLDRNATQVQL
ncbi:MAG TPA: hypothetical protein P5073_03445, partial [Paludibacteraceae bacterium]|nr:hypothetical protein [Paludibacteraceae bacterium]